MYGPDTDWTTVLANMAKGFENQAIASRAEAQGQREQLATVLRLSKVADVQVNPANGMAYWTALKEAGAEPMVLAQARMYLAAAARADADAVAFAARARVAKEGYLLVMNEDLSDPVWMSANQDLYGALVRANRIRRSSRADEGAVAVAMMG